MTLAMMNLLPSWEGILDLLETIAPDLQKTTHQAYAIQPIAHFITVLRFIATGSFQRECKDIHGLVA